MNRRLTEQTIRATCREMLSCGDQVSGRGLCTELKRRYGAVGRTERVFQLWRAEIDRVAKPMATVDLEQRLAAAEARAVDLLARAERAELRERAHQDHWALEIDRLRQEVNALRGEERSKPFAV